MSMRHERPRRTPDGRPGSMTFSLLEAHPPASVSPIAATDGLPNTQLKQHVEALERLEEERAALGDDIKERYAALKADGFDVKVVKALIAERRKKQDEVSEFEMLFDTYKETLGMGTSGLTDY